MDESKDTPTNERYFRLKKKGVDFTEWQHRLFANAAPNCLPLMISLATIEDAIDSKKNLMVPRDYTPSAISTRIGMEVKDATGAITLVAQYMPLPPRNTWKQVTGHLTYFSDKHRDDYLLHEYHDSAAKCRRILRIPIVDAPKDP